MPLFYGNAPPPFYSEAYLELENELQNWNADDAVALTLHFHGSTNQDHNVATDSLYVAVQDDRGVVVVVQHPDSAALLSSGWQTWTIDLEQFGDVDLGHVARLMVGIGNRNNPRTAGESVVYIDDIGLTAAVQ